MCLSTVEYNKLDLNTKLAFAPWAKRPKVKIVTDQNAWKKSGVVFLYVGLVKDLQERLLPENTQAGLK